MAAAAAQLTTFPAFMRVDAKKVAIFGNGAEAAAKARLVANTSADILVYSDAPDAGLTDSLERLKIEPVRVVYSPEQMDGATLVFAATGDAALDREIVSDARTRRIPANAVDQPDYCDFLTPALVNRAPVAIAIGTEGAGPVLAQMIRARVDQMLSPSLGKLARLASDYRVAVDRLSPRGVARRRFWRRFLRPMSPPMSTMVICRWPVVQPPACCGAGSLFLATSGWWALVPARRIYSRFAPSAP